MKKLNIFVILLVNVLISLIIIVACDNQNDDYKNNLKNPEKSYYITGPYSTNLTIRRHYNWKIVNKPPSESGCISGTGLCISGDETPDPNNPWEYGGMMACHATDTTKVIFIFPDNFIEDAVELIDNGNFVINVNINVNSDFAELLGFESGFTIEQGSYEIIDDDSGFQEVIVDIYF